MAQETEHFEELEFYQRRKLVSTLGLLDPISAEFIEYYQNDLRKKETAFIEKHGPKPVLKESPLTDTEANKWNVWHENYRQEFDGFDSTLDNLKSFLSFDYSCIGLECATNPDGPADFYKYYQDKGLEAIRFLLNLECPEEYNVKDPYSEMNFTKMSIRFNSSAGKERAEALVSKSKEYNTLKQLSTDVPAPKYLFRGHLLANPKGSFSDNLLHTTPRLDYATGYARSINVHNVKFYTLIKKHERQVNFGFLSVYKPEDSENVMYAGNFGFETKQPLKNVESFIFSKDPRRHTLDISKGKKWHEYLSNGGEYASIESLLPAQTLAEITYFIDYSKYSNGILFDLSDVKTPLLIKAIKKYSEGLERYSKIYSPIKDLTSEVDNFLNNRFLNNQTTLTVEQKFNLRNSYQNSVEFVLGQAPEDITQIPSQKLQGGSGVDIDYIPFGPLNDLQKKWYFTTRQSDQLSNAQLEQMLEESQKNKDYIKHLAAYGLPDELSDQAQQSFAAVIANRLPHKVEQAPEPPPIATQPIIAEPAVIEEPPKDRMFHTQGSVFSITWTNGDLTNHTTTILGQPIDTTGAAKWLMFAEQSAMMFCRGVKTKFSPGFSNKN